MERQEVVEFILNEIKRLNEEEHIHDLNKAKRYDELAKVECRVSNAIVQFISENDLNLENDEIPQDGYLAVAIWINTVGKLGMISDNLKFADNLVKEAGLLGKSIAYKLIANGLEIVDIYGSNFFDDSDCNNYDEYVKDIESKKYK